MNYHNGVVTGVYAVQNFCVVAQVTHCLCVCVWAWGSDYVVLAWVESETMPEFPGLCPDLFQEVLCKVEVVGLNFRI